MDPILYFDAMDIHTNFSIQDQDRLTQLSYLLNGSTNVEALEVLFKSYQTNRRLEQPFYTLFICTYSLLITFGALGNGLVCLAVIRKPSMRTARNMFIINLAVSDLLLCVITMPLTLMEILTTYWPLGDNVFLCKLFGSLQATSIFVSTISIIAIALDRLVVIVYPTKRSVQKIGAVIVLGGIWILCFLLATPLFIWRKLVHETLDFPKNQLKLNLDFCHEDWPTEHGRAYYSIFTIIFQYLLPVTIVSLAYLGICIKLRYRMKPGHSRACDSRSAAGADRDNTRVRRTNILLISIALIFGISWMPLNVMNVVSDLANPFEDQKTYFIIYAFCHMIGMSSACSNPVLYGWLNENFRSEFRDIWSSLKRCCCRIKPNNPIPTRSSISRRVDAEHITVQFKKSRITEADEGDVERSTLITQVIDRQS